MTNSHTDALHVLNNAGASCGTCGREPGDPLDTCLDCQAVLYRYVDDLTDAGLLTTPPDPNRLTVVLNHSDTPHGDDYALHLDFTNDQPNLNITDYLWAALIAVAQHAAHAKNLPEELAAVTLLENLTERAQTRYTPNDDH